MRVWLMAGMLVGCNYQAPATSDGQQPTDSPSDVPTDQPPDSSTARVTAGLLGLWTMDETSGVAVNDTSGLAPVTLTIADETKVSWGSGALTIEAPVDIKTAANTRLVTPCKATDEVTIEAWVTSTVTSQAGSSPVGQPARVVTFAVQNLSSHLIGIGQLNTEWVGQVRTDAAGLDTHGGTPLLSGGSVTAGKLTHLVLTSTTSERSFYVDGVRVFDDRGGLLDAWTTSYTLDFGGDPSSGVTPGIARNAWFGSIHLVAMYERALTAQEVQMNMQAGP
jgi:hypothetical protein